MGTRRPGGGVRGRHRSFRAVEPRRAGFRQKNGGESSVPAQTWAGNRIRSAVAVGSRGPAVYLAWTCGRPHGGRVEPAREHVPAVYLTLTRLRKQQEPDAAEGAEPGSLLRLAGNLFSAEIRIERHGASGRAREDRRAWCGFAVSPVLSFARWGRCGSLKDRARCAARACRVTDSSRCLAGRQLSSGWRCWSGQPVSAVGAPIPEQFC